MKRRAGEPAAADAALEALAQAIAPRVAELVIERLRERGAGNDDDDEIRSLLGELGYTWEPNGG